MHPRPDNAFHTVRDRGDVLVVFSRLRLPLGKFYVFLVGCLLCLNFIFLPQAKSFGWNLPLSLGVTAAFDLLAVLLFTFWMRGFAILAYTFDRDGFIFRLGHHRHRYRYDPERPPYVGEAVDPDDPEDVPEPAVFLPGIYVSSVPPLEDDADDEDEDDDEPHELVCADEEEARWLLGEINDFRARFF